MKTDEFKANSSVSVNTCQNKRITMMKRTEMVYEKGYEDCVTKLINTMLWRLDTTKKHVSDHGGDKNMFSAIEKQSLEVELLINELQETPSCISDFDYRKRLSKCIMFCHYMLIGINAAVSEADRKQCGVPN